MREREDDAERGRGRSEQPEEAKEAEEAQIETRRKGLQTHTHTDILSPKPRGSCGRDMGIYKQKGQPEAEKSSFSKCTHHPTKRSAAKDGSMRCWHFIQVRLTRLHRLERSQTSYENWTYYLEGVGLQTNVLDGLIMATFFLLFLVPHYPISASPLHAMRATRRPLTGTRRK